MKERQAFFALPMLAALGSLFGASASMPSRRIIEPVKLSPFGSHRKKSKGGRYARGRRKYHSPFELQIKALMSHLAAEGHPVHLERSSPDSSSFSRPATGKQRRKARKQAMRARMERQRYEESPSGRAQIIERAIAETEQLHAEQEPAPWGRAEHLRWAKDRAIELCRAGNVADGYASFVSDLGKHDETKPQVENAVHLGGPMILAHLLNGPDQMIEFIEGFN